MTPDEWDQALGWIEARWPHLSWTSATVAAVYDDLADYEYSEVVAALQCRYDSGEPMLGPAALRAETLRVAQRGWELNRAARPALPITRDPTALPRLLEAEGVTSLRELVSKHRADKE